MSAEEFVFPNIFVNSLASEFEGKRLTLCLCGYPGCGKSKTARRLRKRLGSAALLPLSSFALSRAERIDAGLSGCDPRAFDLDAFEDAVHQLQRGEDISVPRYDHNTGRMSGKRIHVPAHWDILIIEDSVGITAEVQRFADFTLCFFPESPAAWREFAQMRDVTNRGYSPSQAWRLIEQSQREIEDMIVARHSEVDIWIQTRHAIHEGNGFILYRMVDTPAMSLTDAQR